ncbi:MAG: alpha/beta fold hydrolase [Proteobacteria bacterium]|nr:alpha/beta fold hydrolase [Pseudomonadota bacterium]
MADRKQTLLLTGLGLAVATIGVATLAPERLLEAEFARQRMLAGARRFAIDLDGHRWRYLDTGAVRPRHSGLRHGIPQAVPRKPVLVLVHGFTGSKENWLPLMRQMSGEFRLIAPDLPGWGESQRHAGADYGVEAQVERLTQFLDALPAITGREGPPDLLVGHSMGGQLAGLLAARHPELVPRLVLMSAAGVLFEANAFGAGVLAGDNPFGVTNRAQLKRYFDMVFHQPPAVPWPFSEALIQRRRVDAAFEDGVLADIGRGPSAFALERELGAIAAPTLLLWGQDDQVIDPSAAAIFAEGLRESRTILLNGCGHMPMMEHPRKTALALRDFLA